MAFNFFAKRDRSRVACYWDRSRTKVMLALAAYDAYNDCMQYTIRDVIRWMKLFTVLPVSKAKV